MYCSPQPIAGRQTALISFRDAIEAPTTGLKLIVQTPDKTPFTQKWYLEGNLLNDDRIGWGESTKEFPVIQVLKWWLNIILNNEDDVNNDDDDVNDDDINHYDVNDDDVNDDDVIDESKMIIYLFARDLCVFMQLSFLVAFLIITILLNTV